jgi:hypothetical protein
MIREELIHFQPLFASQHIEQTMFACFLSARFSSSDPSISNKESAIATLHEMADALFPLAFHRDPVVMKWAQQALENVKYSPFSRVKSLDMWLDGLKLDANIRQKAATVLNNEMLSVEVRFVDLFFHFKIYTYLHFLAICMIS